MKISLNGEEHQLADTSSTVPELIAELKLPPETLLIEHNGLALHRSEWNGRELSDGDTVELVRLTAGG